MMFAIERLLKAMLLVVGVLAVGLGLYAAFQIQEADAHNPFICTILDASQHKPYPGNPYHSTTTTNLSQRSISGTCGVCRGSATLTSWRQRIKVKTERKYKHLVTANPNQYFWSYCHSHSSTKVSYQWSPPTTTCHNSSCGG